MLLPLSIIAGALLVRSHMRTGRVAPYDVLAKLRTPGLLRSARAQERCIEALANGLALVNAEYLNARPNTPSLYTAGVRYCDDGRARYDEWCDIPTVLSRGCGDCDDLVPWRLAELWRAGETNAEAMAIAQKLDNGNTLFHLQIRFGDGRIEDPSQRLGM